MVGRGCHYVENSDNDDHYDRYMNKCRYSPNSFPPIRCVCDEELCNGGKIDAWAEELAANITIAAPDSPDSESPETMDYGPPVLVNHRMDPNIAPASSDDSLKSADPEMIVLLISVVITFML